jgi:hypothetical protein
MSGTTSPSSSEGGRAPTNSGGRSLARRAAGAAEVAWRSMQLQFKENAKKSPVMSNTYRAQREDASSLHSDR